MKILCAKVVYSFIQRELSSFDFSALILLKDQGPSRQWRTQKIFMGRFQSAKIFLCTKIESM